MDSFNCLVGGCRQSRPIDVVSIVAYCVCAHVQVMEMARIATAKQLFGGQCTLDRVLKEMSGWSDHSLHGFAGVCVCVCVCASQGGEGHLC